jgi:DNA-cytosine methyltransferase
MINHGSLFSGIGGFDLAAKWCDWNNVFHCEKEEYQQKVLKKHFPESISYTDIYELDATKHKHSIDVISGGFPCQRYSTAGKQMGDEPLKKELLRIIGEIEPKVAVIENVFGFISPRFAEEHNQLCIDLENMGYQVQTYDIDAASCGLPTLERHIWIIAKNNKIKCKWSLQIKNQNPKLFRELPRINQGEYDRWSTPESRLLRVGEGVSRRMDRLRVGAIGNAIPPQVAYYLFKNIEKHLL